MKVLCYDCGLQDGILEVSIDRSVPDIVFIIRIACSKCNGTTYLWFNKESDIPEFVSKE